MKSALSFSVLFFLSLSLYAQPQIGIRAGIHGTTVRGPSLRQEPYSVSPLIAVPVAFSLNKRFGLRVEPTLLQTVWRSRLEYTDARGQPLGTGHLKQLYWSAALPVLLTYQFLQNRTLAVHGLAGPSVAYVLSGRYRTTGPMESAWTSAPLQRREEFGWTVGVGASLHKVRFQPYLDLRYGQSLTRFPTTISYGDLTASRGFQFALGLWLSSRRPSSPE